MTERPRLFLYFDKHDNEIMAGMTIRIGDDPPERVYACFTQYGDADLGINASNEDYLKRHPEAAREYYSLSNFRAEDIEIVEDAQL